MKRAIALIFVFALVVSASGQDYRTLLFDTTVIKHDLWDKDKFLQIGSLEMQKSYDSVSLYHRGIEKTADSNFKEAIIDFKKSLLTENFYTENIPTLSKNKFKAETFYLIAGCYAEIKQYDSAIFYYRKSIEEDGHFIDSYIGLSAVYYQFDNIEEMLLLLQEGVENNEYSAELLYNLGYAYLYKGKKAKAKKTQKQLIELFPDYYNSYFFMGVLYYYEYKLNLALKNLNKTIEINPEINLAYYLRGTVYLLLDDLINGWEDIQTYYKTDSTNPFLSEALAMYEFKFGSDSTGLIRLIEKMENEIPDSTTYLTSSPSERLLYDIFLDIKNGNLTTEEYDFIKYFYKQYYVSYLDESVKLLYRYLDKNPNSLLIKKLRLYYHYQYCDATDYPMDEVYTLVDELLDQNPNDAESWFLKGQIYTSEFKFRELRIAYKKGLEIEPEYVFAYYVLGLSYVLGEEYDLAIDQFKLATVYYPDYIEAYDELLALYHRNENYVACVSVLNRMIELYPYYYLYYKNMGFAYNQLNKCEECIEYAQKAIDLNPKCYRSILDIALCELKQGNNESSLQTFHLYKQKCEQDKLKDFKEAIDALKELQEDSNYEEYAYRVLEEVFNKKRK